MRTQRFVIALLLLANLGGCGQAQAERSQAQAQTGFAVVELFTSEGCSSCPPADALLSELGREAARSKTPVYTLSFHVDYWNRLGWRDPCSAAWASARQRAYADVLAGGIYTPQIASGYTPPLADPAVLTYALGLRVSAVRWIASRQPLSTVTPRLGAARFV